MMCKYLMFLTFTIVAFPWPNIEMSNYDKEMQQLKVLEFPKHKLSFNRDDEGIVHGHKTFKNNSVLVTFNCESCTENNKFSISGAENLTWRRVDFPLSVKLKQGNYKMTYWQNKIRQIHLPFVVKVGSKNIITVK